MIDGAMGFNDTRGPKSWDKYLPLLAAAVADHERDMMAAWLEC